MAGEVRALSMNEQDSLQRFIFEETNIRGEIVRLNSSLKTILAQHEYPEAIRLLLSETLMASVLLAATIKFKGHMTLQFQSDSAVKLLVAKCDHELNIRGFAQFDAAILLSEISNILGNGQLVVTIQLDQQVRPYQSIIPIRNNSIIDSLEFYFMQSEQLPTRIRLAVNHEGAVGILLQLIPTQSVNYDFPIFAEQLYNRMNDSSLLAYDNKMILKNLYEEHDIRLFSAKEVNFKCSCDLARMRNAIYLLGEKEANEILQNKHFISVTCEFCCSEYAFSPAEVADIFRQGNSIN